MARIQLEGVTRRYDRTTAINKLSLVVSMAFAATVLHEKFSRRSLIGLALLVAATLTMTVFA